MPGTIWSPKDPDEVDRFGIDWALRLGDAEVVSSSTFTALVPAGLSLADETDHDTRYSYCTLSGGTAGLTATLRCLIETSNGNILEEIRTLDIVANETETPLVDYTTPSAGYFLARYPSFGTVSRAVITEALADGATKTGNDWEAADWRRGVMLYAAHIMTLDGLGSSPEATALNDGSDQYRSMQIGSLKLERFDKTQGGGLLSTRFGQQYRNLVRINRGGPRVSGGIYRDGGDGDRPLTWPWSAP